MQKYIAVVNSSMTNDEISSLISQDIAGALFSISHQNYALAAKLIKQVKDLSRKHNKPVSLIQDVSGHSDPMELEFGIKSGVDWLVVDTSEQVNQAKKLNQAVHLIWKGEKFPKNPVVDSIIDESIADPDARVGKTWGIKHRVSPHVKQNVFDTIAHMANHAHASAVAVSDLETAKAMSMMRPKHKIIFAPHDSAHVNKASIYWGVHPIFDGKDLHSSLRNRDLLKKGERYVDATDEKHVTINSI